MKFSIVIFLALCSAEGIRGRIGFNGTEQDWGFVDVRPGANMFWWLYYTTANVSNPLERPLIIWLEGGPGVSGTANGNFYQFGLCEIDGDRRSYSWIHEYNILYIDHPVGTGFSHADDDADLPTTNHQAVSDIFNCVQGFLLQIPEFQKVPTYIAGESYGGKVGATLAWDMYQAQKNGVINSNLKGALLSSPWISGIDSTETWPKYLLGMARIDSNGYDLVNEAVTPVRIAINEGRWSDAATAWWKIGRAVVNATSDEYLYFNNVLTRMQYTSAYSTGTLDAVDLFMNGPVKGALGLDVDWKMNKSRIYEALIDDFMRPVMSSVEDLLNKSDLKIVVTAGQLDLIVNHLGTVQWIEKMDWSGTENWRNAKHEPVYVDGIIEAYHKGFENFSLYWILRAGHEVASENPLATRVMLQRLTSDSD